MKHDFSFRISDDGPMVQLAGLARPVAMVRPCGVEQLHLESRELVRELGIRPDALGRASATAAADLSAGRA